MHTEDSESIIRSVSAMARLHAYAGFSACMLFICSLSSIFALMQSKDTRYKIQESLLRIFGPHRSTYRHGISVTNI